MTDSSAVSIANTLHPTVLLGPYCAAEGFSEVLLSVVGLRPGETFVTTIEEDAAGVGPATITADADCGYGPFITGAAGPLHRVDVTVTVTRPHRTITLHKRLLDPCGARRADPARRG